MPIMSDGFNDQEKTHVAERADEAGIEAEERTIVYWAPSPGYAIANFVPEKFSGGRLIQRESPLKFLNHIVVADPQTKDGQARIKFIEASGALRDGIIKKCEDVAEALTHTAKLQSMRKVKQLRCEDITTTKINIE